MTGIPDAGKRTPARDGAGQTTNRLPALPVLRDQGRARRVIDWLESRRLVANYLLDDGDGLATTIAFNALFSLLPLLLVFSAVIGLITRSSDVNQRVEGVIVTVLPPAAAEPVLSMVESARMNTGSFGVLAVVGILLAGSRLFTSLDKAFARIYRTERRPYVERRLVALIAVPLATLLMIAAAIASTAATVMIAIPDRLFDTHEARWVSGIIAAVISYVAAYLMALTLYATIPNYRASRAVAWPGAAVAAVLFMLLAQVFPLYMRLTGGFGVYGGAFALALVLMFWIYLLGQIIVLGAEINAIASGRRDETATAIDNIDTA
ncbi:MAG TPA: YihY/virulence factor BrkB family protein [Thermomicrobiales bacterium]|nr:YihY/virulence factor BrkB family protein [Thermomicrobiales bacterium]